MYELKAVACGRPRGLPCIDERLVSLQGVNL